MTKKHLFTLLFLAALSLTVSSGISVHAEEDTVQLDSSVNTNTKAAEIETRLKANATLKANIEAQRAKMTAEIEARKKAAEAKGDEMQAKREAMKLEMETKRAEMDAKREEMRVEAESKRASSTAKRIEFQQENAKRKVANVTKVITATIERLEKIITRIESRIAKIKAEGGSTTEAEGYVSAAKLNLADAKAKVALFASIDLSSETAKDNFEKIRTAAAEARELIRAAHENLMLAVRSLSSKELNVEVKTEDSANTTVQ